MHYKFAVTNKGRIALIGDGKVICPIEDMAGYETIRMKIIDTIVDNMTDTLTENADANVFGKETLGKNIMQLSGLTQAEIEKRIQNQENIPINFEAIINGKTIQIEAEGLSLNVYLIFQRQYFEKNQKHLDEEGWTWLLKTFSASRVVDSGWYNDSQLGVSAADSDASDGHLACRLSRSFSS